MRVLIACEFSGIVREAFAQKGHDVTSCDLLPTEQPTSSNSFHYIGDVRDLLSSKSYDLMVAHPPCTYLCVSGARWWKGKRLLQKQALDFVIELLQASIPHIALENPKGIISTYIRKSDQIIQPYMFGHGETKETHLWLKNLPKLTPTLFVNGRRPRVHELGPSSTRWKERSRTYVGIAEAMAAQWGSFIA